MKHNEAEQQFSKKEIFDRIRHDLASYDVVLYLKGSAAFPQCGFSAALARLLEMLEISYKDIDVLSDSSLRHGLKEFAQFPMTPQLYIKGEFVGGCDIVRQMYDSGELQKMLIKKGINVPEVLASA